MYLCGWVPHFPCLLCVQIQFLLHYYCSGADSVNGFAKFAPYVCLALGQAEVVTRAEAGAEVDVDAGIGVGVEVDAEVLFF